MTPTNEAGHGLPELPDTEFCADHEGTERLYTADQVQQYAIDYAAALALSRGVPADMVLVPREPTDAMLDAMHESIRIRCDPNKRTADIQNDTHVWAAMLAAAPAAAGAQGEEGCGACGDGCKDRAGCELAEQSPPIPQPTAADGGVRERDDD